MSFGAISGVRSKSSMLRANDHYIGCREVLVCPRDLSLHLEASTQASHAHLGAAMGSLG